MTHIVVKSIDYYKMMVYTGSVILWSLLIIGHIYEKNSR